MPIASYSVLKGRPIRGKVVSGASEHYQSTVEANGKTFTAAVNIESVDGSEVLYAIRKGFTPPDRKGLQALAPGMTALKSSPGVLALDYVRDQIAGEPMITRSEMALLPKRAIAPVESRALENAVVQLLNAAVADGSSTVWAFGSAFSDNGVVDGIHDLHMNQGNPVNDHDRDNGVWQDGALFLEMKGVWTAVFLAFQTESWTTDQVGNPAATVHRRPRLEG